MSNEEKARELAIKYTKDIDDKGIEVYDVRSEAALQEMAEWKDEQAISELDGWHTEEPVEDGWYLVDTPDFPKNCYCVVAEWDSDAKKFYSEASDFPIEFCKWKLIERR